MSDMIGLSALFGRGEWTPNGPTRPTVATASQFQVLLRGGALFAGKDAKKLLANIPFGTPDTFQIEPRSQRGFKFEWVDTRNVAWHVHGHEPDQGAQAGHVGGQTWVVRIRTGEDWLLSSQLISQHPAGHAAHFEPTFCHTPALNWSGNAAIYPLSSTIDALGRVAIAPTWTLWQP